MAKPSKPEWVTSRPDWEERIVNRQSLMPCGPLFPGPADEAWSYIRQFVLADVAGKPQLGEVALPWIEDLVKVIFGAEDPKGRRQINEFFIMVSKKNSKSTIAAAVRQLRQEGLVVVRGNSLYVDHAEAHPDSRAQPRE